MKIFLALLLIAAAAGAEEEEPVIITATRIKEDVAKVPSAISVISGAELKDRGVADLRGALSLVSGVEVAPGADAGPAASVPEFWGLKEFDAFLLVVDGVPWGGTFNPALADLDLRDVERIEVMRGAAPVMYGATSFVGVIHVIHKSPKDASINLRGFTGNFGSRGLGATVPLSPWGNFTSVVSADLETQGFKDPRTRYAADRLHWRGEADTRWGKVHTSLEGFLIRENPASPRLLQNGSFLGGNPLDSNVNMVDAFMNEDRFNGSASLDHETSVGTWTTLAAYSHSTQKILRGFWNPTAPPGFTAHGFRENIYVTDLYFDSHFQWRPAEEAKIVVGADHTHGRGYARGGDFDYLVNLNGDPAPSGARLAPQADVQITDQRDFSGLYGFFEWEPLASWVLEGGLRVNRSFEMRQTSNFDLVSVLTGGKAYENLWHGSGSAALTYEAWKKDRDLVNLFAAYKDTYKPAAIDFGLDTDFHILAPETAESYELGAKSRWFDDRVDFNVSSFLIDFRNMAVPTTIAGNPALMNAGKSRFSGLEFETSAKVVSDLTWRGAYSLHAARYRDFLDASGAAPVQLGGKRVENSARNMFSTGLIYAPKEGFTGNVQVNYVGSRILDKANASLADPYAALTAGAGWRHKGWEVRLDARNITDERAPVSQSEMGAGQYYLLPARRLDLSANLTF